ncbi:MAG: thioredoxin family protein, partial [Muribaculaceae bacterium]|nr:thioredoxin family protein [Muribaculaceae bacterium]
MNDYESMIRSSEVVMVEFYATWCPHCMRMMPVVAQIRELLSESAQIFQIDVDKDEAATEAASITSTPTFIIYKRGEEVWRGTG